MANKKLSLRERALNHCFRNHYSEHINSLGYKGRDATSWGVDVWLAGYKAGKAAPRRGGKGAGVLSLRRD